jgi:hypothetical protein
MKQRHFIHMTTRVVEYRNSTPPVFRKGWEEERHGVFFTWSYYSLMGSLETPDLFIDHVKVFYWGT